MIETKEQAQQVLNTLHMPIDAAEEYARLILDAVRIVHDHNREWVLNQFKAEK